MNMLRTFLKASVIAIVAGLPAKANEPVEPVKTLVDMASYNAGVESASDAVYSEYFSASMLLNYFSEGFVDAYAQALIALRKEHDIMLFDHDPVLGGQESCVPKDVTYDAPQTIADVTVIKVRFKASWCYDGEYEGKNDVTEVTYRLVQEDDEVGEKRFFIDDIQFVGRDSLRALLQPLAR
ncbi:hypothetical protein [Rhizobium sp. RU36D]|uniref:hypothetical protein n=1 Tax=Rhizobium sp. RU36D TaxID=1907415 RepID=UPI0009D8467C|nr:hypothetical protein [Rhizobium sp. RU36D]SMC80971.1 hypothetical protein SAMN05880593_107102 [Rhizobium sp. RU36D]